MAPRILIVDDSAQTLVALAELVSRAGFDVVTATGFEEAKQRIDEATPDLLVVDIRLGAYNGLHLAVRERIAHPQRPVIMTTGFPDPTLEAEAHAYGAEFIAKPIRSADLLAMIRRRLGQRDIAVPMNVEQA